MGALEELPSGQQKFVLGRWLGYGALEECEASCAPSPAAVDKLEETRGLLELHTKAVFRDDEEDAAVAVERFLTELPGNLASLSQDELIAEFVEAVRTRVEAYLASPSDPFDAAFEAVIAAAKSAYGVAAGPPFGVRFAIQESGGFRTSIQVDGTIEPSGEGIDIEISLTRRKFGLPEMRAIPYAISHEVVVHALASEPCRSSVGPFAESWMDFVAFDIHRAAVRDEPPFRGIGDRFQFGAVRTVDAGETLHNARHEALNNVPGPGWLQRFARDGARELRARLVSLVDHGEGPSLFWALSAGVNSGGLPEAVRNAVATGIVTALEAEDEQLDTHLLECAVGLARAPNAVARSAIADDFFRFVRRRLEELRLADYHSSLDA